MVHLVVNGVGHDVDVPGEMPLLWVLRDRLGLTGTKYGCGIERCGACTVIMGKEATRSCVIEVKEAVGRPITTIEGLSPDSSHPVQKAWIEHQVPQCGFCQSGVLMVAAARMAADHGRADEVANEIENICVCGTYQRMIDALDSI